MDPIYGKTPKIIVMGKDVVGSGKDNLNYIAQLKVKKHITLFYNNVLTDYLSLNFKLWFVSLVLNKIFIYAIEYPLKVTLCIINILNMELRVGTIRN